jgi:hypothetical protein
MTLASVNPMNTTVAVNPYATVDLARSNSMIQISINLTNAPPINGFTVSVAYQFRPWVLKAASLDYSNNVLSSFSSQIVSSYCLDGVNPNGNAGLCHSFDGQGVTSFGETVLGGLTANHTSGSLFTITFNVNTTAPMFSQIRIVQAILSNGQIDPSTGKPQVIPVNTLDGYYTSLSCGGQTCPSAVAKFTWLPQPAKQGQITRFYGNASLPSSGATITDFTWSFDDPYSARPIVDTGTNSSVQYLYTIAGNYSVTLKITDSRGVQASNTQLVVVINVPNTVGDFRITANPTSLIIRKASINDPFALAVSTITLTSINGFSGTVTLTGTPTGFLGENFNPSQVNLAANSSANASLVLAGGNSPPGTYFVTVTGTSGSISHFVTLTIQVVIQPDFQLFISIPPGGNIVFAGGTTSVGVQLFSTGISSFNGTVTLTGQVSPPVSNGPTLSFDPTQITFAPTGTPFSQLTISTTASTPPGNYTITVKGTSGTLVHTFQLQLTVLLPPVLTLSPTSGPVGTQVKVHGSGFLNPSQGRFFPVELQITFDDQLVGFFFLQGSSFNFTFDVPDAQAGIVHQVHAKEVFPSSLDVQASFLVLPEPSTLTVSVSSGTIYFPGDTAIIFATSNLNGQPTTITSLQLILVRPNGSNITLNAVLVTPGVYKASYVIPTTGSIGTYAVVVKAQQAGSSDGSALASFEVKPTWLQANGRNVITATSIVGAVGTLGVVALAWRKGYFTRRKDEFPIP